MISGIFSLIEELKENEQRDCGGDLCHRVHILTAERLIKKSYNRGVYDCRKIMKASNGSDTVIDSILLDT